MRKTIKKKQQIFKKVRNFSRKYFRQFLVICVIALLAPTLASCSTTVHPSKKTSQITESNNNGSSQSPSSNNNSDNNGSNSDSSEPNSPSDILTDALNLINLYTNKNYQMLPKCRVTAVSDGDTLTTDCNSTRIRLVGVDTPETIHPSKPVECYGKEASDYTKQLIGQTVYLESDPSQGDTDIYGRPLRFVYLSDGTNFNMKLILEGYGRYLGTYSKSIYMTAFKAAEEAAKASKNGLWDLNTCNGGTDLPDSSIPVNPVPTDNGDQSTGSKGYEYWYGSAHCVKIPNDGDWYECTRKDGSTYKHTGS